MVPVYSVEVDLLFVQQLGESVLDLGVSSAIEIEVFIYVLLKLLFQFISLSSVLSAQQIKLAIDLSVHSLLHLAKLFPDETLYLKKTNPLCLGLIQYLGLNRFKQLIFNGSQRVEILLMCLLEHFC